MSVLVVDASQPFRQAVVDLLARRGYAIVGEAWSAATAIACVRQLDPNAVLLDVDLPDQSGFELAARLKRLRPGLAVLMTSAGCDDRFYALARQHGAGGYVPKSLLSRVELARFWPRAQRPSRSRLRA